MNDPEDQVPDTDDPAFDDPAFAGLRAELAGARVTEPIPPDVAARLDATLASLQAERPALANVVPLRRRFAPVLVAAAAAVVVVAGGVGIAQIAGDGSSNTMSAESGANNDAGAGSGPASPAVPKSAGGQSAGSAAKGGSPAALASVPELTTARFAEQVARIDVARLDTLRDTTTTAGDSAGRSPVPTAGSTPPEAVAPQPATVCPGPGLPDTESVPILLDGHTAVLVLHAVSDGEQVIDAWSCDGARRLATATVAR